MHLPHPPALHIDFGVRHTAFTRLTAFVVGLLMSFGAPGLAVAHGAAHAHLAHEHREHAASTPVDTDHLDHADRHDASGEADMDGDLELSAPAKHRHGHDYASLNIAPTGRDLSRFELTPRSMSVPVSVEQLWTVTTVRSLALQDPALLARPAPSSGPPPTLRGPPAH